MAALLLFLLLLPTATSATSPPKIINRSHTHAEPHEPIIIETNADLIVPDTLSRNGVRRGSGTATDPYVIERWEITAANGPAVSIADVDAHIHINEVKISGNEAATFSSIEIRRSRNIVFQNIVLEHQSKAIDIRDSTVRFSNSKISDFPEVSPGDTRAPHIGVAGDRSSITLSNVIIHGAYTGIGALNSRLAIERSNITAAGVGIKNVGVAGEGLGSLSLREVALQGLANYRHDGCSMNAQPAPSTRGILIDPAFVESLLAEDVEIDGFEVGTDHQWGFDNPESGMGTASFTRTSWTNNGIALAIVSAGTRIDVQASSLENNAEAINLPLDYGTIPNGLRLSRSVVANNGVAVRLRHDPGPNAGTYDLPGKHPILAAASRDLRVSIRENDIIQNCQAILYEAEYRPSQSAAPQNVVATDNYWGAGGPRTSGLNANSPEIRVQPAADGPHTTYDSERNSRNTSAVSGLATVAILLVSLGIMIQRRQRA